MRFLSFVKNLFTRQTLNESETAYKVASSQPSEYQAILAFNKAFRHLFEKDCYIARSNYKELIKQYRDVYDFIKTLNKSGLRQSFIKEHKLNLDEICFFEQLYAEIKDLKKESQSVHQHNEAFIQRHLKIEQEWLDNVLKECDPQIRLDDEQRRVVLSDEDYTLVIAGAGAGKTTTVAAKVRYLVEKEGVKPKDILVISFTNKAVDELRERINTNLHIQCPISTFHSIGYTILQQSSTERKRIVTSGFMYNIISDFLKSDVLKDADIINKLVLFFSSYFTAPYDGDDLNKFFSYVAHNDCSTLKSNMHEYIRQIVDFKTKKSITLNNEILRSMEEVRLANFLYMHQIDYEYEPVYPYHILDANKPYTPDFIIRQGDKATYIEHFGISEEGKNDRYDEATLQRYKDRVNEKIKLHRAHKTDLIYTFSSYRDGHSFLDHLRTQLLLHGFKLTPRSTQEVYSKILTTEESKYITRLTLLICTFIGNFKTQGYKLEQFDEFKRKTKNVRTRLFLDICCACYCEYQKKLDLNNCIDFEDLINESARIIHERQISQKQLDYKYIIVDEYQDISRQRYNLIRELSKMCQAKIVAVGDDWQSIYAFSGSILPLFTRFCQEVGYGQELKITRTYRNAQEVIDIAGNFVQKNSSQIRKKLISPKHISNPISIWSYRETFSYKKNQNTPPIENDLGMVVNQVIETIINHTSEETTQRICSILFIGRYGFDARNLCHSKQFNYDEKSGRIYSVKYGTRVKLQFLTAHSSKGLSADNVILINAKDSIYGFPSKVDDDPILNLVVENDTSYNYAEERRLFYVALTRTKNRVFILTPDKKPSVFIKELLSEPHNYPNVTLNGTLDCDLSNSNEIKNACPICGYPMRLRYNKNYGLKLWICSNDQEVCGFMTNNPKGGKLCIQKCDWCKDGYLIVKNRGNQFFLGCTNYKNDHTGCGRTLNADHYSLWHKNQFGVTFDDKDLPSFVSTDTVNTKQDTELPPIKPHIGKPASETKPIDIETAEKKPKINYNRVHSVDYQELFIKKEGFMVMIDEEGKLLTDMTLLHKLRALRTTIAKEENLLPYYIFNNEVLVRLATECPVTHEEFVSIKGLGEVKYEKFGRRFIALIKKYYHL